MTRAITKILLTLALASPSLAEPIPGLDDPAFRAPFERALQGDDPTALQDLHAAAEGGNTAALLAYPTVFNWLRQTMPFAQRKAYTKINGLPFAEAAAAADPVAALWAMGDAGSDMDHLLRRAFALYQANEPDKATVLFMLWVNQTGGFQPLSLDFFVYPVPPWAMAFVLRGRLTDPVFSTPEEADALLASRLRLNDPAAWLALAAFAGLHQPDSPPPDTSRIATILAAAGIAQEDAQRQMQAAVPVLRVIYRTALVQDAATAQAAAQAFRAEPGFEPVLALCQASCPATAEACVTAFVATYGHPYSRATADQPLTALLPTAEFFATPRGRALLLRSSLLGDDPATSPLVAGIRQIDACLADAVLAAQP